MNRKNYDRHQCTYEYTYVLYYVILSCSIIHNKIISASTRTIQCTYSTYGYTVCSVYVTFKAEFYRMSTFHKINFIESRLSIAFKVNFL